MPKPLYKIITGNALTELPTLKAGSARCCVTSPPYWGLRAYGTPPQIWGGDAGCRHKWGDEVYIAKTLSNGTGKSTLSAGKRALRALPKMTELSIGAFCKRCGAWLGEYGNEPTPELYVQHTVAIFTEVYRVLADDGTLWLNLGDSYAGDPRKGASGAGKNSNYLGGKEATKQTRKPLPPGLRAKELVGIPWMVAFALRAAGWLLRQEIIWHKPNAMPDSATDRCGKAHEHIFLLTKQPRYYYDNDAVKERAVYAGQGRGGSINRYEQNAAGMDNKVYDWVNMRTVWSINVGVSGKRDGKHYAIFPPELPSRCIRAGSERGDTVLDPFSGSGTTAAVATELGRRFVGIELNPAYVPIAHRKVRRAGGLFNNLLAGEVQDDG